MKVRSPLPALARIGHGHVSVREARAALAPDLWQSYFKFAIVRNPFDRFVSVCAMLNKRNPGYRGQETAFMKTALNVPRFRQRVLVRPQAEMLTGEDGQLGLDYVGRYESLTESFTTICSRIGLGDQALAVANATEHEPFGTYYDSQLQRLVGDFYRQDFALFNYPTTLPCA